MIQLTKEELVSVLSEWYKRYNDRPNDFEDVISANDAEGAADYFVKLLKELRNESQDK